MIGCPFVIPARLERATHSLEGCCSIQLSYGTLRYFPRESGCQQSGRKTLWSGVQIYGIFSD